MSTKESAKSQDFINMAVEKAQGMREGAKAHGVYKLECFDKDGNLKWVIEEPNLVVNQGLQDMNTKYFKGASYTAAWYLGLYGAAASNNPVAGSTAASPTGITEVTAYSQATRVAVTFGTATTADPSVISNSASPSAFSINGTTTVGGAFLISDNTKSGTSGVLFSASDNQSPGDRSVINGDTVNVTYTFNLDAA